MANKKVAYELNAVDKTATGINSAVSNLQRLDKDVAKVTKSFDIIKNSVVVGLGITAAKAISDFVGSCVTEFADMERNSLKLNAALHGNMSTVNDLTTLINSLASSSSSTKDDLEGLVTELALLGKSPEEIEKLTRASVVLSEVTGQSLDGAFTQLNATLSGSAGKLEKLIPELGGLTEEELKSGEAIDLVINKMGVFTSSVEESWTVKIKTLKDSFGDLKEVLGEGWAETFKPMVDAATAAFKKMADLTATANISKKIGGLTGTVFGGGDVKGLRALRDDVGKEAFDKAGDSFLKLGGGLNSNKELITELKALLAMPETTRLEDPRGYGERAGTYDVGDKPDKPVVPGSVKPLAITENPSYDHLFGDWVSASDREPISLSQDTIDGMNQFTMDNMERPDSGSGGFDLGMNMDFMSIFGDLAGQFSGLAEPLMMITQMLDPIGLILKGFFDVIGPAITQTVKPLFDAFQKVGGLLAEALFPILNALAPVFSILANLLISSLMPILDLLMPVIEIIAGVLNVVLTPMLKAVAVALEVVRAPLKYLGDLFSWVANAIKVAVHNLVEYIDHPISESNRDIQTNAAFSSDAFTGLAGRISAIWNQNYGGTLTAGTSTVTGGSTTGAGAAYSAQRDIIFNYYHSGSLVGNDGITEFALQVRDVLTERNILGR